MPDKENNSPKPDIDGATFTLSEYTSLREEMLKRIEFQHQIITLTLIGAGTFLSIGVQANIPPTILMTYPILVMFFAIGWFQHNLRVQRISTYIRIMVESRVMGGGWEQDRISRTGDARWSATVFFARGTFVGTQVVTVLIALSKIGQSPLEIGLLIMDVGAVFATWMIVRRLDLM